jgi:hypothetical protein
VYAVIEFSMRSGTVRIQRQFGNPACQLLGHMQVSGVAPVRPDRPPVVERMRATSKYSKREGAHLDSLHGRSRGRSRRQVLSARHSGTRRRWLKLVLFLYHAEMPIQNNFVERWIKRDMDY